MIGTYWTAKLILEEKCLSTRWEHSVLHRRLIIGPESLLRLDASLSTFLRTVAQRGTYWSLTISSSSAVDRIIAAG